MKIWHKLLLAPGVALIGFTLVGALVFSMGREEAVAIQKSSAARNELRDAVELRRDLLTLSAAANLHIATVASLSAEARSAAEESLFAQTKQVFESVKTLAARPGRDDQERQQLEQVVESLQRYTLILKSAVDFAAIDLSTALDAVQKSSNLIAAATAALTEHGSMKEAVLAGTDTEMAELIDAVNTWVLSVTAVALALVTIATIFSIWSTTRPLARLRRVADAIAAGDFSHQVDSRGRDEVSDAMRAFAAVQSQLGNIQAAQLELAREHASGNTDHRIDAARFPGSYGELAQKVNELVAAHVEVKREIVAVVSQYAQGNFAPDMARLPGQEADISHAIDGVKQALGAISTEIDTLVAAAVRGDFSTRGEASRYSHSFAAMVSALNQLMATCERGLTDADQLFAALARGDLSARITADYAGLFGTLKQNGNIGMSTMAELVTAIRSSAEMVNAAAGEIARGSGDLSSRTSAQAASLEETSASIEQMSATVGQNAANAREADTVARGASDAAETGGATVNEVITTFADVASSSKRIADIIAVIDGIALQTNILALNAAVEAARAGDQGRGFAVVATEVRSLAQRSAAAAKEIKTLIGESVMRIDAGAVRVQAAGEQMQTIVGEVKRVSIIIAEIATASQEQSSGISQVSQAVGSMDSATQQNAALVEEASASASSLQTEAEKLLTMVQRFKLGGESVQRAPDHAPEAALQSPTKAAAKWDGMTERRGKDRAKNVARLGKQTAPTGASAVASSSAPAIVRPFKTKNSKQRDDEWEEF